MKRNIALAVVAMVVLVSGSAVYAHSTFSIKPAELKDGETKTFSEDGRTVTVRRDGDRIVVNIDKAGEAKKLVIVNGDSGEIKIDAAGEGLRSLVIGPERRRIVINDRALEDLPHVRPLRMQSWFVCPKDGTALRVPEDKQDESFKCPIDGTPMEKKKAPGFTFFFGDGDFDSNL